ncbi:MAG: hypothetical protein HPY44_00945 [Armatimonadetes bacterium]|nr:hypothetical protein [Armatimonadota bacterium]
MSEGDGGVIAGEAERCQWVTHVAQPGKAVRFEYPGDDCEAWVVVRPLTYRESLERESVGTVEEYELDDHARVLSVRRQYDLWAMRLYELERCLVDFALPERGEDGRVRVREAGTLEPCEREVFLSELSPEIGEWIEECLAKVNLRDRAGRQALDDAKKK